MVMHIKKKNSKNIIIVITYLNIKNKLLYANIK